MVSDPVDPLLATWGVDQSALSPYLFVRHPQAVLRGTDAYSGALDKAVEDRYIITPPDGEIELSIERIAATRQLLSKTQELIGSFLTNSRGVYLLKGTIVPGITAEDLFERIPRRTRYWPSDENFQTPTRTRLEAATDFKFPGLIPQTMLLGVWPEELGFSKYVQSNGAIGFFPHPAERPDEKPSNLGDHFGDKIARMLLAMFISKYDPSGSLSKESYVTTGRAVNAAVMWAAKPIEV